MLNGELSEPHTITLGVPQGSILGPLLFNVYINSLPNAVKKTRMILYADDAVLFCDASTRQELQIALEREFTKISNWYTDKRLTINVKKTKLMLQAVKGCCPYLKTLSYNQMVHKSIACSHSNIWE